MRGPAPRGGDGTIRPMAEPLADPRLKSVTELYGRHPDSDIYVVGTGPSMRVFPTEFLAGRITIGLNMAWKLAPLQYGITIHPELNIPEFMGEGEARPGITWVTKHDKLGSLPPGHLAHAEKNFYFFRIDGQPNTSTNGQTNSGRIPEWLLEPTGDFLYLMSSISQPAVNLAAHMGARNIILVGCDNAALFGNHHAHEQHTAWLGATPDHRYHDYYTGLAEARRMLRRRGVNLVSLNPFLTLGPHEEDFVGLCHELGRPELIPNRDLSELPPPPTRLQRAAARARAGVLRRLPRRAGPGPGSGSER